MLKKNLAFRYLFAGIFVAIIALFSILVYKNNLIETQQNSAKHGLNLSYKEAFDENKRLAELIFFNNLLYDKTINTLYNKVLQQNQKEPFKEHLYAYLKDKFFYFKTFGIKNITFYLPNNEVLLNMDYQNIPDFKSKRESVLYVNSTQKELQSVEVTENSASLVFIKPLLDDELKHLGAIEMEFDFDVLAKRIEKNNNYRLFFVHENTLLQKNILKPTQEFTPFELHSQYQIQKSAYMDFKYNKALFEAFNTTLKEEIANKMNAKQEFVVNVFYEKQYQMVVFIPFFNDLTQEHTSYLVALGNHNFSEISQINYFLNQLIIMIFLALLIIFILFYNVHSYKEKNRTIVKEYTDLLKAIDKYVVMTQTDKSGFITYITQAFCDISGYSKKELIGRNINIIRHPDMSKKFFENMWKSLYKEQKWEGEIKNIDKNGNSYWVKGIIFPKYDIRNELIGYTSIRVNITDAKQLKKINNLLKEDLSNKLNEIKMRDESLENTTKIVLMGKILDSLSHQWKKPMSTISIELANFKARIVNNELDTLELQKIHDEIAYQLKSLSITLNEFKTFFSHSNQNDKYNVKSALDEAILVVKPECDLHHIDVLLDAKEAIYCYGVFNELKQIMINLLKNSIEHLIANNIKTPYIKFGIIENEGSVIIECIDNVQGASKQIIEKVFSNNYDEQVLKDAGLNLYIAKLLLEKIGAKVRFEIKKEYSRFVIELVSKDRRKDKRE
jgi:PAS domain S-box-containing protein